MGIAVGLANWGFEKVGFAVCRKLESAGVVQRFHKGGTIQLWALQEPYRRYVAVPSCA